MIHCPVCGEWGRSVSQIALAETKYSGSSSSVFGGGGTSSGILVGGAAVNTSGVEQTARAREFQAPEEPQFPVGESIGFLVAVIVVGVTTMTRLPLDLFGDSLNPGAGVAFERLWQIAWYLAPSAGAVILALGVCTWLVVMKRESSQHEQAMATYAAKRSVWESLFYCEKDGIIFNHEGRSAAATRAGVASLIAEKCNETLSDVKAPAP